MKKLLSRTLIYLFISMLSTQVFAQLKVGDTIDRSLGRDQHGKKIHSKDFKGKVLVVYFWKVACAECMVALQHLEAIRHELPSELVEIVAINVGAKPDVYKKLRNSLKKYKVRYVHDRNKTIGTYFGDGKHNRMYFVDKKSKFRKLRGWYKAEHLEQSVKDITSLINESAKTTAATIDSAQGNNSKVARAF